MAYRAHGEDSVWGDRGADRVVLAARVALDRAPRFGPRRGRVGGAEGRRGASGWPPGKPSWIWGSSAPSRAGHVADHSSSQMTHLWDALCRAYRVLGFESGRRRATTCFAIWCWRGSSNRPARSTRCGCSTKTGVEPASYPTVKRRLPVYRQTRLSDKHFRRPAPHMPGWGRQSWCCYDVSTLYFETDAGDGFREPGFSKERRLEPQITLGLLTDAAGFPLTVAGVRGQQGRDRHDAAGDQRLQDRPPAHRRHRGRRCRDDLRGQPGRPAGRRVCRSSWAPGSRSCPTWCANGATNTPMRRFPTGWC